MKQTAGTLLYRFIDQELYVLLIHHAGKHHRSQPWGIPKGAVEDGEDEEAAARRETYEETGMVPDQLTRLGSIIFRSTRKRVHCFTGPAPADAQPHCASPEINKAQFLPIRDAYRCIHPAQRPFLTTLEQMLLHPKQE